MKALGFTLLAVAAIAFAVPAEEYPTIVTTKKLYAKNDFRGKTAPEFVVETWLGGKAPEMKGKVIVVDFWATWCGPCRDLIPEMNKWKEKFKNDVVFIGLTAEKQEVVTKFIEKTKMNYPIAIDTKKRMSDALGVQGIPHCMVISPDNIVRWQGFPQDSSDTLTEAVLEKIVKASKKN